MSAAAGIVRLVEGVADRGLGEPLVAGDDGRVDLEATRPDLLSPVRLDQPVADVAEEVRLTDLVVHVAAAQNELRGDRFPEDARRDHAGVAHRAKYLEAPRQSRGGNRERVVDGRGLRETGEQRRLRQRQLRRRLREVRPRRCLDAVRAVAVVDLVQIGREDSLLRPRAIELRGETRLLHLPLHGLLARDVEVPDELLGDRRASLDDAACADVRNRRACSSLEIDAVVLEEASVLDCDRGLADP